VLLVTKGMNRCQVAEVLGDAPRTVAYWMERFQKHGLAGLQEGVRSGRPSKLSAEHLADLQQAVRGKPRDMGLEGNLWVGKTMSAYLNQKHQVKLGPRRCRRLLLQWRFRYRKPRPVHGQIPRCRRAKKNFTTGQATRCLICGPSTKSTSSVWIEVPPVDSSGRPRPGLAASSHA